MDKTTKITVGVLVAALVVLFGYILVHPTTSITLGGAASPVGTSNTTPRIVETVCNNVATSTYATFLNSGASDRVVQSVAFFFTGYGTSPFSSLQAATTTAAAELGGSTNYVVDWTLATTTDPVYAYASQTSAAASTTLSIAGNAQRIWKAGSYLNFKANATSTGYCNIKVEYIPE